MTTEATRPLHDRPPVTTSSVQPVVRQPKGRVAHEHAVARLVES